MSHVIADGAGVANDAIEITGGAKNIWIDHCELYADLTHGKDYYDGLLDIKNEASFITVSNCNVHDHFKVSLVSGLVIASPWVFWQIWAFVAAGLYPHEKHYVNYYLPFSLGLFLAGAACCQWVVLPQAISALLWFNEWLNVDPDLRLNEYLGFAILFPVFFGLSFQTPLVMLFMERIGLMTVESYKKKRAIAFFILAVIAAIGPTMDAFSMIFQWIALCLLYQLGIWLCMWSPRKEPRQASA